MQHLSIVDMHWKTQLTQNMQHFLVITSPAQNSACSTMRGRIKGTDRNVNAILGAVFHRQSMRASTSMKGKLYS